MSLNVKKWQSKCTELQKKIDEEILIKEEILDKVHQLERKVNKKIVNIIFYLFAKVNVLGTELDESNLKLEESEKKRKSKEEELLDLTEHIDEYLSNFKKKLDTDLSLISVSDILGDSNYKVFILGRFRRSKQWSQGSR
jgi:hypothetical protein